MKRAFTLKYKSLNLEDAVERLADALRPELIAAVLDGKIDLNEVARAEKDVRDRFAAFVKENEMKRANQASRAITR